MAKVTVQPSGKAFEVRSSQTVLEAALEAGINMPYGCRTGACGSCKGKVIEGKVTHDDYQDSAMTDAELTAGNALFCCARPLEDLVIESRVGSGAGIKPRILPARVSKKERLADDVMLLHLQLPSSEHLQFLPGQYIEFLLKDGKRRAFSIANAPHADFGIELHLRKDSKKPIIFAATGTGFAPIKGIIEDMLYNDSQRPMTLYWGGRKPTDLYMDDLCQRWAKHVPTFTYVPVLSKPDADWNGRTGYVQQAVTEDVADLSGHEAYACGLPEMVNDAKQHFAKHGLLEEAFFSDAFTFAQR